MSIERGSHPPEPIIFYTNEEEEEAYYAAIDAFYKQNEVRIRSKRGNRELLDEAGDYPVPLPVQTPRIRDYFNNLRTYYASMFSGESSQPYVKEMRPHIQDLPSEGLIYAAADE